MPPSNWVRKAGPTNLKQISGRVAAPSSRASSGGAGTFTARMLSGNLQQSTGTAESAAPQGDNFLMKALKALDKPRAAVVNTVAEVGDLMEGRGFSLGDIGQGIATNRSTGDILKEQTNLPSWARAVLGFGTDVALDPITYMGPAQLLKQGGKAVARQLADPTIAAKLALDPAVIRNAASEVMTKGVANIDPKVLKALGEFSGKSYTPGVYFGAGSKKVRLPGTTSLAKTWSGAGAKARNAFVGTGAGAKVATALGGRAGKTLSSGDSLTVRAAKGDVDAMNAISAGRAAQRAERVLERELTVELKKVLAPFKGDKLDLTDMRRGLEGDAVALARLESKGLGSQVLEVRQWLDSAADEVGIPRLENYFPRQLSREARAELRASLMKGKPIGPAMKRELVDGSQFMGETLRGSAAEIRDQIEDLVRERAGREGYRLFSDDPTEVLAVYAKQIARRKAQIEARNELIRRIGVKPNAGAGRNLPGFTDQAGNVGDVAQLGLDFAGAAAKAGQNIKQAAANLDVANARRNLDKINQSVRPVLGDAERWQREITDIGKTINRLEDRLAKQFNRTGQMDEALQGRIQDLYDQQAKLARRAEFAERMAAADVGAAEALFESATAAAKMAGDDAGQVAVLTEHAAVMDEMFPVTPKTESNIRSAVAAGGGTQVHNAVAQAARQLVSGDDIDELVDVLTRTQHLNTPRGMRTLLAGYDELNNFLKRYQILTPGFHIRNAFGGEFNNWLAGVDRAAKRDWRKIWVKSKFGQAPERLSAAQRRDFDLVMKTGSVGGNQAVDVAGEAAGTSLAPWANNFWLTQKSRNLGGHVEGMLRGELALDTLRKTGGDHQAAFDAVAKFHFDYDDLSAFERDVAKRIIPFYTWTRKNLPLQLEQIGKQPAKYTAYLKAKGNIESMSEPEDVVPGYFGTLMGIRLPKGLPGLGAESHPYWMPDLPFRDLGEYVNPSDPTRALDMVKSSLSVPIKLPLEAWGGKQFFNDQPFYEGWKKAPGGWSAVPGLLPALSTIGWAEKGADGKYYMDQRHAYYTEQLMPILARVRRVMPSGEGDEHLSERQMTSILSTVAGLGLRANTPEAQASELSRRKKEAQRAAKKQRDLGYIP